MALLQTLLQADAWRVALEKYGAATGTAVSVYEVPDRLILGPIHPTAFSEAVNKARQEPAMFAACVRQCLARPETPVIIEDQGVAVIGTRLALSGEAIGVVVAGYGLTAFPEEAAVRRFTLRYGLPFLPVWRAMRGQAPLTTSRLAVYAELLVALTESLLNENVRLQEYERTATRLAEANKAKDRFLAMLAHELRNPLAPIRIAMQVMSRIGGTESPDVQKARDIVDRQVKHLTRLLDDLLDVARITSGKIELHKEPVNLATAVANALEASRGLIEEREHTLAASLPEAPVFVDADPMRLEQVIINLLNNAAKYTPPHGQIRVIARRENAEAVLRVQDNGIGIAPDLLPYVFDLFIQADRTLARSEGGLGIGLTIVRNLVEVHDGTIAVDSEGPGQGSEFVVRLPLASGTQTGSEFPVPKAAVVPALRILVIEDHPDTRELLRAMLELDGHRVEVAEDGPPGVVIARALRPDVVLIDIGLPSLDGYEVGRQLRRDLGKSVTLIALTGYSQPTDRRRSTEAGFDAHLVKPASPEEIRDVLAQRTRSMARE